MGLYNIGNDFYAIVNRLGENVTFDFQDNPDSLKTQTVKACLETATSAAYSMVDREFLFKGNMVIPFNFNTHELSGMYFQRDIVPNTSYLMISAIPEPTSPKICFVYAVQCNSKVSILKRVEGDMDSRDQWGNIINKYYKLNLEIPCYWYTTLRSYKIQNNGKLDQAIYTMYIPAKYKLSPMDKVLKKTFVDGEYKEEVFNVDSVETALTRENESNGIIPGIVSAQLTLNLDKVVVEDEEP